MNEAEFKRAYVGEFKDDGGLRDIALMYHYVTEIYDRFVCRVQHEASGNAFPTTKYERMVTGVYAHAARAVANGRADELAGHEGVDELALVIRECSRYSFYELQGILEDKDEEVVAWQADINKLLEPPTITRMWDII